MHPATPNIMSNCTLQHTRGVAAAHGAGDYCGPAPAGCRIDTFIGLHRGKDRREGLLGRRCVQGMKRR